MPIMQDVDRFTTSRTTNFSRKDEKPDAFADLTGRDMYRFLSDDTSIQAILKESNAEEAEKKEYSQLLDNDSVGTRGERFL